VASKFDSVGNLSERGDRTDQPWKPWEGVIGSRCGATQRASTVTVGGGAVAAYLAGPDTRMAMANGAAAMTDDVVVTTTGGASNAIAFTVGPGNIYCAATPASGGSDINSGLFPGEREGL